MQVIKGTRGTGKTRELIKQAVAVDGTIVCMNPAAMLDKIHKYGYAGLNVISYQDYVEAIDTTDTKYFIDEIEGLISYLSGTCGTIAAYTICTD